MLEYWDFNEGTVDDAGAIWDVFKAYLRDRLIQYLSYLKKQTADQLSNLEIEIKDLGSVSQVLLSATSIVSSTLRPPFSC